VTVDIKIIAATNQDLEALVEKGRFRKDLYYRLDTIKIEIPPLKDRTEDIFPLMYKFLNKYNKKYKTRRVFTDEVFNAFLHYPWPGNVRELEHMVERLILISEDELVRVQDLPPEIIKKRIPSNERKTSSGGLHIPTKEEEQQMIIESYIALRSTYKVAEHLNISQSKVARIIKRYREEDQSF